MEDTQEITGPVCPQCGSAVRQLKYGKSSAGSQRFRCHACQKVYTAHPKRRGCSVEKRQWAVRKYVAGYTLRTIGRGLGVSHQAVGNWVKAHFRRLKQKQSEPPKAEPERI